PRSARGPERPGGARRSRLGVSGPSAAHPTIAARTFKPRPRPGACAGPGLRGGSGPMRSRLRACTAFVLDMDGTIYVDERLLPGAAELLGFLEARGHRSLFVTNNSSRRGAAYQERLARLGVDVPAERILTSGDATI